MMGKKRGEGEDSDQQNACNIACIISTKKIFLISPANLPSSHLCVIHPLAS